MTTTTPLRLDTLLPEVLDYIVSFLPQDWSELDNISRVSSALLPHTQRRILSHVALFATHWTFGNTSLSLRSSFLPVVQRSPAIAGYVRTLTLRLSTATRRENNAWDETLPQVLDLLEGVRVLRIVCQVPKKHWSEVGEVPVELRWALERMVRRGTVEAVVLYQVPPTVFLHCVLGAGVKHLSYTGMDASVEGLNDGEKEKEGDMEALKGAKLESLSLDHLDPVIDVGFRAESVRWHLRHVRTGDLGFVHALDLSNLRKLDYGTIGALPDQGDLLKILAQCSRRLEELRVSPYFRTGEDALDFLNSPSLPPLSQFPVLEKFETTIVCTIAGISPENSSELLWAQHHAMESMRLLSSWFLTANESNVISHITLVTCFQNIHQEGVTPEDIMEANWASKLGLDTIDRALTSKVYERLRKVTAVIYPIDSDSEEEQLKEVRSLIFSPLELERMGKLDVISGQKHRQALDARRC